jgi:hypothetical protein
MPYLDVPTAANARGAAVAWAFVLVDNLAHGHRFYDLDAGQEERIKTARDAVLRASIAAALRELGAPVRWAAMSPAASGSPRVDLVSEEDS